MDFDVYLFADYSGSHSLSTQRKRIVLAIHEAINESSGNIQILRHLTRSSLWLEVCQRLARAHAAGQRAIIGFDHSYSFPNGFYQRVTAEPWTSWRDLLRVLTTPTKSIPPLGDPISSYHLRQLETRYGGDPIAESVLRRMMEAMRGTALPRAWAHSINQHFAASGSAGSVTEGPFWGTNWAPQDHRPDFPFNDMLPEKRLVERVGQTKLHKTMKPIYQLGGHGSVGQQSLCGIPYLRALLDFCDSANIPLFCWPFDGWEPNASSHVLVEVYPTLYNRGLRTDEQDAIACVEWMMTKDAAGSIPFAPSHDLTPQEWELARLEGWVIGV